MFIVAAGIFAAALFYGDALITPAISVLSAVEGLQRCHATFETYIIPITVGVLTGLFFIQRTARAEWANCSGPVMLLWFGALAALGIISIAQKPHGIECDQPHVRHQLRAGASGGHVHAAVGGNSWHSPAVKHCMPTWGTLFPSRATGLVWSGLPGTAHQLFRPGRTGVALGGCHSESFLPAVAEWFMLALVALAPPRP